MKSIVHILPIIIMTESFAASIIYCIYRQWGSALYWLSAGVLNFAIIFCIKRFG